LRSSRATPIPPAHISATRSPPPAPELVLSGETGTPQGSAARVVALLAERGWI